MFREFKKGNFLVSTHKDKLDIKKIYAFLKESYWANKRKREVIKRSINNSLCFGIYDGEEQIGFARVVTDYATFAYLCDVYIQKEYREQGIGKYLMECIINYPDLENLRLWQLATKDAHGLYRKYGFDDLKHPELMMQKFNPDV